MEKSKSALFLDRDGVLLRVKPGEYINTVKEAQLLPNVIAAMDILRPLFDYVFVVTNQAGIGYGRSSWNDLQEIHDWIEFVFGVHKIRFDYFYVCPHTKEEGCDCRKPRAGLFRRAIETHGVDPERCVVVGDTVSDIQAAMNIHALPVVVLSGILDYGKFAQTTLRDGVIVEQNLYDFARSWKDLSDAEKAATWKKAAHTGADV